MLPFRHAEFDMPSIFLSHSSKDKFFVRELAAHLQAAGIRVWLDEAEIKIGDSLTKKIGEAVEAADFVGAVLSANSVQSEWVQRELQVALQKEIHGRRVVVLPILIEPVSIPPFLKDKLYADFTVPDSFDRGLGALLRALGVAATPPPKPPPAAAPRETRTAQGPIAAQRSRAGLETFEDIEITELDEHRTHNPDPSRGVFNVYLRLSARPPTEWTQIFDAERRFPRHSMWRRAWIEGAFVVVQCPLHEVERYHDRDLRLDVQNANEKFRGFLTEQVRRDERQRAAETADAESIRALKRKLLK